jgi:beta-galactosidase
MSPVDETALPGRIRAKLGRIGYGGDYNPEQWSPEIWAEDIELMTRANVNLVTLGVFGWAQVEPLPGSFDFGMFDRIIEDLHRARIQVCLATMTASPPAWLSTAHPEMLPIRADGTRLWPGGRQHFCPSSPVYREHAVRLVEQLAARYGDHPALAVWHVGNEYGVHVAECYCDVSAVDFREWLRDRYGSVEALNESWSTTFWSQHYSAFDEVLPPRTAAAFSNPAQQLDFARFSSDAMLACFLAEAAVLREVTPEVPLTTNFCGIWKPVDYWAWAPHLDIASIDSYPDPSDPASRIEAALSFDIVRSLKAGQPWLLMEQAPSAVNWRERNAAKPSGGIRLDSWQAVARGADAVMFFQWRQSRGGAEKWHSAMVPHAGPESRTFQEVTALGAELASHLVLADARVEAEVALVIDWPSWWALELDSHPSVDVTMREALLAHYSPLFEAGVTCDVVPPDGDLVSYRLVVVPNLYLVTEEAARNLTDYVRGGGHLVVSFFSGVVDECDRAYLGGYLGPLRDVLGARVEEWMPLQEHESVKIDFGPELGGGTSAASLWSEVVRPSTARVLGRFGDGELAGAPAVLSNTYGDGTAWYLATRLDRTGMRDFIAVVLEQAGAGPVVPGLPAGVEAVSRVAADGNRATFLLNHRPTPVSLQLPDSTTVDLDPFGVAVVDLISPSKGL